jgi:hypothetical protein
MVRDLCYVPVLCLEGKKEQCFRFKNSTVIVVFSRPDFFSFVFYSQKRRTFGQFYLAYHCFSSTSSSSCL